MEEKAPEDHSNRNEPKNASALSVQTQSRRLRATHEVEVDLPGRLVRDVPGCAAPAPTRGRYPPAAPPVRVRQQHRRRATSLSQ
jgi:hypothetical protein